MFNLRNLFLKKIVVTIAIITLNTVILFTCVEVFIGMLRFAKHKIQRNKVSAQSVLNETMDLEYAPWVQFKAVDFQSAHTNVKGLLRKSQPDICGDGNSRKDNIHDIYFFGGSTMFGINVSDNQTIPSHFADILSKKNKKIKIRVLNYGQPYYYSTQELFLLFSLIAEGKHPKTVVFLDGLNDVLQPGSSYCRYPFFTPSLKEIFSTGRPRTVYLLSALFQKTNTYFALRMSKMFNIKRQNTWDLSYLPPKDVSEDECAKKIVENYLAMIKTTQTLCRAFNIKCYFFWQPVPYYNYNRSGNPICDKRSFPMFAKVSPMIKEETKHTKDLYYLGDLLLDYKGSPFVDWCHYSSSFNERIADEMLQVITIPDDANNN